MARWLLTSLLVLGVGASAILGACSCGKSTPSASTANPPEERAAPTLRIYALAAPAGAVEPCGCSKDQLGGVQHLAAHIEAERASAPNSLVVGAGPLFFQDPKLAEDERQQRTWKAEAMAKAMKSLALAAWAPAVNDWAAGAEVFAELKKATGAVFVGANVEGAAGVEPHRLVEVGGLKVGIVGLSNLAPAPSVPAPEGVTSGAPDAALARAVTELEEAGARVIVAVAAMDRGAALRLAERAKGVHVFVVGKPLQRGDANDKMKPPTVVGDVLVVEAANHLQTLSVVDLFVDDSAAGPLRFADAGGAQKAEQLVSLSERIRELEMRLNHWETDKRVDPKDVAARRSDLQRLRNERYALEREEPSPASGSYFRARAVEIRDKLGDDAAMSEVLLAYYKRVNEHNKVAFADRKPEPAPQGTSHYVGVEACTECHAPARKVWDQTAHARAYATLQKKHVEYNLECVGCHVTGYGKPGGSTVTHNERLLDVGCEVCHGPGSKHCDDPEDPKLLIGKPDPKTCVSECHHPPHVEGFDPEAKMQHILGPGHGQ